MILRPPSLRDRMILPEDAFNTRRHREPGRRPLEFLLNPYRFGGGAPITDRIYMDFEGANGSTTFTDAGTAASTWSPGGTAALTTATVLAGTSSLSIPTTSSVITTPYNSSNRVPPTGNWSITFQARSTGGWVQGGVGTVLLSCQDNVASAAGTAFVFATNSTGRVLIIMSDGATRSVIVTGTTVLATSTTYTFTITRTTNTITLLINGVSDGTGTFSGTVNTPVGQSWRIGLAAAGNTPPAAFVFDTFRVS
jgi:hypothetical protein